MQCRPLGRKVPVPEQKPAVGRKVPVPEQKPAVGLRIDLVHRDSWLSPFFPGNITSTERVKQAVQRSQARVQTLHKSVVLKAAAQLAHKSARIQGPISAGSGEFLMEVGIGEPPLSYSGILDTGSDLIWTQCLPCDYCYNQSSPIYDPIQSSTFMTVPCDSSECQAKPNMGCNADHLCNYRYAYGDDSFSTGTLSIERFTFSSESVDEIQFGCGVNNEGHFGQTGGMVGFGRGDLSLISQLGSVGGDKFAYCLTSFNDYPSRGSPLFIGHTATFKGAAAVSSTPFIQNSAASSSYYLSLLGISLGGALVDIPDDSFDIDQNDGSGGFVIDSGTTFTFLYDGAYQVLRKSLISSSTHLEQVDGSEIGLDLCFNVPANNDFNFPTLTFHFEGADYNVEPENYMYVDASGVICLAMLPSPNMSILGNFQQHNYQILYDVATNMFSFAPALCDAL